MAPKLNKEAKGGKSSEQTGKAEKTKGVVIEETVPHEPVPWVNPLPLARGKEVLAPLASGEHHFISILNAHNDPPITPRLQKLENVLDDPYRAPFVIKHYDGSSCDVYFKAELTHRHDLCENCREIWRRWNWKFTPAPPIEIDPYENFLCVGDIDPHFQPARGDIVIFHPSGPQSMAGLRAEWGFVLSYKGQKDFEFHQHDLVVRVGSFSNSRNVVDYIPYDKVEVRAMTKDKQWRFLGGQVALVREALLKPPPPSEITPTSEMKAGKKSKKGKKDKNDKKKGSKKDGSEEMERVEKTGKKKKGSKKDGSEDMERVEKTDKKKKGDKEKKKDKKSSKQDKKEDEQAGDMHIAAVPEFTLDSIPDLFNVIQKLPNPLVPHPGEAAFKQYSPSFTCNYRYNKPGMQCSMGECLPRLGDIIIREPKEWMHDEWEDKKKRPKGSMVKWYKPKPWKRELKEGMLLLRPYIDRYTQLLDTIPHCEYTPLMWSQWGVVELYLCDGKIAAPCIDPLKKDGELVSNTSLQVTTKDHKDQISDKKSKKGEKRVKIVESTENTKPKLEKQEGKEKESKAKNDTKAANTANKTKVGGDDKKNVGNDTMEKIEEQKDEMLWKYWGRSTHYFDEPFQFWAINKFCMTRHLREVQKIKHLDFFVEDKGVEGDLEHTPKVEEIPPLEDSKGKKAKEKKDKSKDKKDKSKEGDVTKKKKKG